jgi:hypothetical protein
MWKILRFEDSKYKDVFTTYLVETELSENDLWEIIEKIVGEFEGSGKDDWSYDDIKDRLVAMGVIKEMKLYDECLIIL